MMYHVKQIMTASGEIFINSLSSTVQLDLHHLDIYIVNIQIDTQTENVQVKIPLL